MQTIAVPASESTTTEAPFVLPTIDEQTVRATITLIQQARNEGLPTSQITKLRHPLRLAGLAIEHIIRWEQMIFAPSTADTIGEEIERRLRDRATRTNRAKAYQKQLEEAALLM